MSAVNQLDSQHVIIPCESRWKYDPPISFAWKGSGTGRHASVPTFSGDTRKLMDDISFRSQEVGYLYGIDRSIWVDHQIKGLRSSRLTTLDLKNKWFKGQDPLYGVLSRPLETQKYISPNFTLCERKFGMHISEWSWEKKHQLTLQMFVLSSRSSTVECGLRGDAE